MVHNIVVGITSVRSVQEELITEVVRAMTFAAQLSLKVDESALPVTKKYIGKERNTLTSILDLIEIHLAQIKPFIQVNDLYIYFILEQYRTI